MNSVALDTAKTMVAVLRNAGFTVDVKETETEYDFMATKNTEWFETHYAFFGIVYHSTTTNRTKKRFTTLKSGVGFSNTEKNISTKDMWAKIEYAIGRKITTADVLAVKAGA